MKSYILYGAGVMLAERSEMDGLEQEHAVMVNWVTLLARSMRPKVDQQGNAHVIWMDKQAALVALSALRNMVGEDEASRSRENTA